MLMVHTHLRGAGQGKPSSSTKQPRRGPRARAGNPGLHFILAKKRLPERLWLLVQKMVSAAQWQALSPLSGTSVEHTASPSQRRPARRPPWKSFWTLRGLERRTPSWGVAWASCVGETGGGLAGYLPPARKRELEWRAEESGAPIRKKDEAKLAKNGFRPAPGMKSFDYAKVISHFLRCAGTSFNDFKAEPMPRLQAGEIRWWDSSRWW